MIVDNGLEFFNAVIEACLSSQSLEVHDLGDGVLELGLVLNLGRGVVG